MLSTLFKKYFTYVSMAQSLVLNIIVGLIFSPFFFLGVTFISGESWFSVHSSMESIVNVCKVILITIFGFIVENGIMYLLCKSIRRAPLELVDEKQWIRQGIIVIVAFLCAVCSLTLCMFLWALVWAW